MTGFAQFGLGSLAAIAARIPLHPPTASSIAENVDLLYYFLTVLTLFFTALIFGTIFVFMVKFRRQSPDEIPPDTRTHLILELTWTIIPTLITVVIFVWASLLYVQNSRPPASSTEMFVVGKQWMWHVQHQEGQSEINALHVPMGRPVKLIMTSEDVIHDFDLPAFRVKQDVVPGRYTYLWFQATRPGTYHLYCAAYCGTDHSKMIGWVTVMEAAEYERWLLGSEENKSDIAKTGRADRSLALEGSKLFRKLQCVSCHSATSQARAPVLEELYGKSVQLTDGRSVRADESYLRESILVPDAKVVAGYRPIMPPFPLLDKDGNGQVSEEDLVKLIAFIKSLRRGDTPSRVEDATPPERGTTLPR
jgi:cytochrome c oxidase subunit II